MPDQPLLFSTSLSRMPPTIGAPPPTPMDSYTPLPNGEGRHR
jgi:hypothetical protein